MKPTGKSRYGNSIDLVYVNVAMRGVPRLLVVLRAGCDLSVYDAGRIG